MEWKKPLRGTNSRLAAFHVLPPKPQTVWQANASRFHMACLQVCWPWPKL